MDVKALQEQLDRYTWYHRIEVAEGVATKSTVPDFQSMWDFNRACMAAVDFQDKRVLDVGCRDGLFSFEAEKRGACEILAIDNDLSKGAREVLVPLLESKVRFQEMLLYDLDPAIHGCFDVVLCFGVLYHLRYPFWGLKKLVDCVADGGLLLLESGMLTEPLLRGRDLLYCPIEESPYEPTSCTFFNAQGLCTTLRSLSCEKVSMNTLGQGKKRSPARWIKQCKRRFCAWFQGKPEPYSCDRQFFVFKKNRALMQALTAHPAKQGLSWGDVDRYWNGLHQRHTQPR